MKLGKDVLETKKVDAFERFKNGNYDNLNALAKEMEVNPANTRRWHEQWLKKVGTVEEKTEPKVKSNKKSEKPVIKTKVYVPVSELITTIDNEITKLESKLVDLKEVKRLLTKN